MALHISVLSKIQLIVAQLNAQMGRTEGRDTGCELEKKIYHERELRLTLTTVSSSLAGTSRKQQTVAITPELRELRVLRQTSLLQ